jgi:hypothetical protein
LNLDRIGRTEALTGIGCIPQKDRHARCAALVLDAQARAVPVPVPSCRNDAIHQHPPAPHITPHPWRARDAGLETRQILTPSAQSFIARAQVRDMDLLLVRIGGHCRRHNRVNHVYRLRNWRARAVSGRSKKRWGG